MRSIITTIVVAAAMAASTATALARPAVDSGTSGSPARASAPIPNGASTGVLTYVLVGVGGVVSLAGAASLGAHIGRRPQRLPVAGA